MGLQPGADGARSEAMVTKIISGGQTGADRAGLDVALELGLAIGGWVPRGRRAEDGIVPLKYAGLAETTSDSYEERTRYNVRDSDATLIFCFGPLAGGSALTASLARSLGRPLLVLDLEQCAAGEAVSLLRRWLDRERPGVLNVAGSRQSQAPRIASLAGRILRGALGPVAS